MRHQHISFFKSGLRLAGYVSVLVIPIMIVESWLFWWTFGWGSLILSEILGIVEEIGHE